MKCKRKLCIEHIFSFRCVFHTYRYSKMLFIVWFSSKHFAYCCDYLTCKSISIVLHSNIISDVSSSHHFGNELHRIVKFNVLSTITYLQAKNHVFRGVHLTEADEEEKHHIFPITWMRGNSDQPDKFVMFSRSSYQKFIQNASNESDNEVDCNSDDVLGQSNEEDCDTDMKNSQFDTVNRSALHDSNNKVMMIDWHWHKRIKTQWVWN